MGNGRVLVAIQPTREPPVKLLRTLENTYELVLLLLFLHMYSRWPENLSHENLSHENLSHENS